MADKLVRRENKVVYIGHNGTMYDNLTACVNDTVYVKMSTLFREKLDKETAEDVANFMKFHWSEVLNILVRINDDRAEAMAADKGVTK